MIPKIERYVKKSLVTWIIKVTKEMTINQEVWPKELQPFFSRESRESKGFINLRGVFFPKDIYSRTIVFTEEEKLYNVYIGDYIEFNETDILKVIDKDDLKNLYEKVKQ